MTPRAFAVDRAAAGASLDAFLAAAAGVSRKQAKRWLDTRAVFVNGRRVWMAHHRLAADDRVELATPAAEPGPRAAGDAAPVAVLHEDPHYLVVDKPAGWLSNGPGSLEERLRRERPEPGLVAVHRLDRDTTGCFLFARSEEARRAAVEVFRRREVGKVYEAIVLGSFPRGVRTFAQPVDGQAASTEVTLLRAGPAASLVEVRIGTGRTHQIRVHLLGAGHPVAGDKAYGTSRALPAALRAVPRQMLHARRLRLVHPLGGPPVVAEAPRPHDFAETLHRLRLG
jgi:23S rRNA pseudouridine1911/1915/1917 synthase